MGKSKTGTPIFVNMLRPRDPNVSLAIAKAFEAGETPNLDQGLFSKDECKAMYEDVVAGKGLYPFGYDPVIYQFGKNRNAIFGVTGTKKRFAEEPANWPVKFGKWEPGMGLDKGRLCHCEDVRDYVHDGGLVTVGNHEYICGTTGDEGKSAPFMVDASWTGAYGAGDRVTKRLDYANLVTESGRRVTKTEFVTVIGQINNKAIKIKAEDGREIVWPANTRVTWGHLIQDEKALTPTQVRKLTEAKGVVFEALPERWVGPGNDQKTLWAETQRELRLASTKVTDKAGVTTTGLERYESREGRSEDAERHQATPAKAWHSISSVQTRNDPFPRVCFGVWYGSIGQAFGTKYSEDGTKLVFRILGGLTTFGLTPEVIESEETKVKKEPKAKKEPKVKKEKKSKKSPTVTAAPVSEVEAPVEAPVTEEELDAVTPELDESVIMDALGDMTEDAEV